MSIPILKLRRKERGGIAVTSPKVPSIMHQLYN